MKRHKKGRGDSLVRKRKLLKPKLPNGFKTFFTNKELWRSSETLLMLGLFQNTKLINFPKSVMTYFPNKGQTYNSLYTLRIKKLH